MIKILIVDDSKFMRINLEKILSAYPDLQVKGTARNGIEALKLLKEFDVDVIVLDFFMPKMDGLQTLKKIMNENPIPTIMITVANREENRDLYFKALSLGAVDVISKPSGLDSIFLLDFKGKLIEKIFTAHQSRRKLSIISNQAKTTEITCAQIINKVNIDQALLVAREKGSKRGLGFHPNFMIILIGASTGGPPRIVDLIQNLIYRANRAIIVVQHMPERFTTYFAERLDKLTNYKFKEATDGMILQPGHGYVAPGNFHLGVKIIKNNPIIEINQEAKIWGVRPSIDFTAKILSSIFRDKLNSVILTGMGRDGADGIHETKKNGGTTIVQDPKRSLIDSMPIQAIKTNAVDYVMSVNEIASYLNQKIM
jgi:two-component system chemotaxis response regulator CheB